jgi:DNA-binding NtrC family response regulator
VKTIRVLSVGRMEALAARSQALMAEGFSVFSTDNPEQAIRVCNKSVFDLAIVGHLLAASEKQRLVRYFRERCEIPVLLVTEGPFLTTVRADAYIPVQWPTEQFVKAVRDIALKSAEPKAAD